ncbi:MAG: isochorismate synthase [Nostocaceae cyanobacterium]|nr:isochorismate synthase [Nostocaceae cyanobacterium]
MQLLPYRANLFLNPKELHQFLLDCRNYCQKNHCTKIVNISWEIDTVDPLFVLCKFSESEQLNFYFENRSKQEAIAAIDAVAKLEFAGKQRFIKAQEFIKSCQEKIIHFSKVEESFAGPYFFCSFSFFDDNTQGDYPFPAARIFLPKWQVARRGDRCILVANLLINASVNIEKVLNNFWENIQKITAIKEAENNLSVSSGEYIQTPVTRGDTLKKSIISSLKKIRDNHFSKIVLADALDVVSSTPFNLLKSLTNLRQLHPNCYIFSLSNGKGQNFIGASPERLISIREQQLLTDALAGSAPRGQTPALDATNANRLLNSEKERHEHLLVIDFITQRLSELGLLPQVLPPRLRQLSNIQHLWTPISAKVPESVHPLQIVARLHPTPAVAGANRDIACGEIRGYESFERGLYAAPIGWIDYQGNSEFIVGIRSALIDGDRARLYAGAGIVAGSDPDRELAEIQLKLQALLKALV